MIILAILAILSTKWPIYYVFELEIDENNLF
jgi:hypothetical protein